MAYANFYLQTSCPYHWEWVEVNPPVEDTWVIGDNYNLGEEAERNIFD
jgi:hypothetical protein